MTCPVMSAGAGFHRHHAASWQMGTPSEKLVARQRPAHHRPALRIDPMNLDNVLCKIDANSCNLFHGTSPFKGFRLTFTPQSWHSMPSPEGGKSLRIPIWTPLNCKRLTDSFGLREAPAVVYPASVVGSGAARADMESASPMRQSIQAAAGEPEELSASVGAG